MERKRERSASYPSYSIEYCIDLVGKIYTNFGGGNYYAKREEIGKALNISAGHLQTQVSSAAQYALLELKAGEGYKPSEVYKSYHKPVDERQKREALLSAFKAPTLYVALINQFDGEILPTETPLANMLFHHHNISDKASAKAAAIFIENARFVNVLQDDNSLSVNSKNEIKLEETVTDNDELESNTSLVPIEKSNFNSTQTYKDNARFSNESIPFIIPLKGKRTAQIVVPEDVKPADFDFLINFINMVRQQFD